ncbi:hypothetical protein MUK42_35359 [Musa troglodytarum]|uniref:Uncharacterized protein n=1 Tax=Musa troglodytarum TaxID=320322 RepID=A0A9E7G8B0_9LILI|nr:hypothetical protein MUK42_35359 [Musa troglodytarum]
MVFAAPTRTRGSRQRLRFPGPPSHNHSSFFRPPTHAISSVTFGLPLFFCLLESYHSLDRYALGYLRSRQHLDRRPDIGTIAFAANLKHPNCYRSEVFVANWPEYANQLRKHLGFANCNFCSAP